MKVSIESLVAATLEEMGWPESDSTYDGIRRTVKAGILAYQMLNESSDDDGIAGVVDDIVGQFRN